MLDFPEKARMAPRLCEILFSRQDGKTLPDSSLVTNQKTLAHGQAQAAFARHKTRTGASDEVFLVVDDYDERLRPFLYAGVLLGESDRR
jgi:hypothetical protein